jgi:sodium transport system permease protein
VRLFVVWTILIKELVEALRDRRTLTRLLLLPILVYPLFAIGVSKFQGAKMEAREARPSRVAVWGDAPSATKERLQGRGKFLFADWLGAPEELRAGWQEMTLPPGVDPDAPEAEENSPKKQRVVPVWWTEPENPALAAARAALLRRDMDVILAFWPGFEETASEGKKGRVAVYFDPGRPESSLARERLERALRLERKQLQAEREDARMLPRGHSMPYEILTRAAAKEGRSGGQILGAIMPMMLILMSLLGGFLPAIDVTAGEKERGTMQTLLCAPLRPVEIIGGKFLAVFTISLLTALLNVVSLALTMHRILPQDVPVSTSTYALTMLLLVPVNFLFSALFLALSAFARDFKDGQNVLMPVYLPLTLLSGVTALPGVELNRGTAMAPVLNIALLIKALFQGEAGVELVFLTLASSCVYAALALLLAARVFTQEAVLLGGKTSVKALLGLGEGRGEGPGPAFALSVFAASLVALFYGSLLFEGKSVLVQHLLSQLGFFLLVPLLAVRIYGFSLGKTYGLARPGAREVAGAVLLASSAWSVVAAVVTWVLPPPPELVKGLEKVLLFDGAPLWGVLMLGAVVPAVCEEALFRGLIFGGLRGLGAGWAVVLSSLLFGLAHGSVYRLLPTFFLGGVMGLLRWRSGSLAPSMVFHGLHNGLAVALLYTRPGWAGALMGAGALPSWVIGVGGVVFTAGLWVALGGKARGEEPR